MKTALVISRHFPPVGSVGSSIRIVKFLKYIAREGWSFVVITQDPNHLAVREACSSAFMENELPESVRIVRVPAPVSVNGDLADHDIRKNISSLIWAFAALLYTFRICLENKINIVYAATPSSVNPLIGVFIKLVYKLPLVVDMKDDWVGAPAYLQKSSIRQEIDILLENIVICLASKVTIATEKSSVLYRNCYKKHEKKFHLITNGYDLEEFISIEKGGNKTSSRFVLMSSASRYCEDYRDPSPLLYAIELFFKMNTTARSCTDIIFLGNSLSSEYDELIDQLRIGDSIKTTRPLVRKDFISALCQADLFFLIQPRENTTAIAGSLYEYWAIGAAPVLLIAEKGASWDFVLNNKIGLSFDFSNIKGIAEYISHIYENRLKNSNEFVPSDGITQFDRKTLAKEMLIVWDECLVKSELQS